MGTTTTSPRNGPEVAAEEIWVARKRLSVAALDVVTGAFSYTGRHIAEALLARGRACRTLTRSRHPEHPLASQIEAAPLAFDDSLVRELRGADTLYNTYWIRFERGATTFAGAVPTPSSLDAATRGRRTASCT